MNVTCINDYRLNKELTKGKAYKVLRLSTTITNDSRYLIVNNLGEERWYPVTRFSPVERGGE